MTQLDNHAELNFRIFHGKNCIPLHINSDESKAVRHCVCSKLFTITAALLVVRYLFTKYIQGCIIELADNEIKVLEYVMVCRVLSHVL